MGVKLGRDLAAKVDAVRGDVPRSAWLRAAVLAFLEAGATVPAVAQDPERAQQLREAIRGTAETVARLEAARTRPLPARCTHSKRSVYCVKCRCLVDPDGFPVRAP